MKNEDAQLVNQFLTGDEGAFTTLVKKYQKSVHALAWRKVGDFHTAEELAQDTFLKAYQKLSTLKNPNQFAGWLYVIADRICIDWHRKRRPSMESLETITGEEIEESSYRHYEDEQREEASIEHRQGRIKDLLEKLPESERTVVTLHYLGEMTYKAISEFLGVSPNTVKSRLQRARNRLKEEDAMVRETLGGVDLPITFTENIVKQVANLKPATPANSKPLMPWAISAATAIFIFLIMGVGSQYLARFQKPYNLNVRSETTVEIIDAPIVLDTQAKSDLRNQAGRFDTTGKSEGAGPQVSPPVVPAAAQIEKETRPSTKQQWVQANGPEGSPVTGLFLSSTRDIYAAASGGIYRLAPSASAWTLVNTTVLRTSVETPETYKWTSMAEHNDTLYLVSADEMFASTDSGETWQSLGAHPKGRIKGLAITDDAFYLALEDKGIVRSTDSGKQWTLLNDVVTDTKILAVADIENRVFVGTTEGLYRISTGEWEKLAIDTTKAIHSLAVSENNLYVGTGPDLAQLQTPEGMGAYMGQIMSSDTSSSWEIFHSIDLGDTWTEITPTSNSFMMKISPGVKVIAAGKTILALGITAFCSTDGGKTWTDFGFDRSDLNSAMSSFTLSVFPAVGVDENTFFKVGPLGLIRSTDAGKSWHPFMTGIVGTHIQDLVTFKNDLYANTWIGIVKSTDGGESWETLNFNSDELTLKSTANANPTPLLTFPKLAISGGVLYGMTPKLEEENELRLFHLSANGNVLVPIQAVPTLGKDSPFIIDIIRQSDPTHQREKYPGAFAVNGDTFYVEYKRRLFRWKRGDSEWFNTGLIDTGKTSDAEDDFLRGFKLAVFGKTVYVGKRDGHLFQSLDGGDTWKDVTTNLPLRFERFNDITFAGATVYVATDTGTLMSKEGDHWRALTDKTGAYTITDQVVVVGTTIYGAGNEGVYQLNKRGEWEKISPGVPDRVISLVPNSDRLYIATRQRGIFHTSIEKESD